MAATLKGFQLFLLSLLVISGLAIETEGRGITSKGNYPYANDALNELDGDKEPEEYEEEMARLVRSAGHASDSTESGPVDKFWPNNTEPYDNPTDVEDLFLPNGTTPNDYSTDTEDPFLPNKTTSNDDYPTDTEDTILPNDTTPNDYSTDTEGPFLPKESTPNDYSTDIEDPFVFNYTTPNDYSTNTEDPFLPKDTSPNDYPTDTEDTFLSNDTAPDDTDTEYPFWPSYTTPSYKYSNEKAFEMEPQRWKLPAKVSAKESPKELEEGSDTNKVVDKRSSAQEKENVEKQLKPSTSSKKNITKKSTDEMKENDEKYWIIAFVGYSLLASLIFIIMVYIISICCKACSRRRNGRYRGTAYNRFDSGHPKASWESVELVEVGPRYTTTTTSSTVANSQSEGFVVDENSNANNPIKKPTEEATSTVETEHKATELDSKQSGVSVNSITSENSCGSYTSAGSDGQVLIDVNDNRYFKSTAF